MAKFIEIEHRKIGEDFPPYVVAEISANHRGDQEEAIKLITAAKKAGADAVKLQTYTADTLTINCGQKDFLIDSGPWKGRSLYDLYSEAHTPWEWHAELFAHAREVGITIFSSPFDKTAIELLEKLDCPAYKIASFEAVDHELIKAVSETGKPVIISTGLSNRDEIQEAVDTAQNNGCQELVLLHCISGYPAPVKEYNLKTMMDMADRFNTVTGISDHTLGISVAAGSVALGASVIEKHFTMSRELGGPDGNFSIEPDELQHLCDVSQNVWESIGNVNYEITQCEKDNLVFRRSLYAVEDIKKGELITEKNVRSIRPGYGLLPKHLPDLLGKTANTFIKQGAPIKWEFIK